MKQLVLGALFASLSFPAIATDQQFSENWVAGLSYSNFSADTNTSDVNVGGLIASLGYKINTGNNLYAIPELRIGTGITDDNVAIGATNVNVKLDSFFSLSLRGQYEMNNGAYFFAAPSFSNADFTASNSVVSASADSWEFGLGGGLGYNFTKTTSAEVMYERFDDTDVLSFGLKFNF